ncbi:MAG: hypothetical protein HY318_10420 [Armatimonadetes bacterium]|nr:hypothetical protein [Armatimonadota bacterium]
MTVGPSAGWYIWSIPSLQSSRLCAGAKEVVCSLWSISNASTSKLMHQM